MAREQTETALFAAAAAGDRLALGRLLLPCYASVARHVAERLPQSLVGAVDVDDLVQNTFVAAIRGISQFESRHDGAWLAWLKKIAERQVLDVTEAYQRRKRGGPHLTRYAVTAHSHRSLDLLVDLLCDGGDTPSRRVSRQEAVQAIRVGVASLPEEQRRAICLHHLDGQSVDDTAVAMRRSPGAVRGLLQRARQSLRHVLGESSRWFSKRS